MKSLYTLLTEPFTFAVFYGGLIAILTLWAMALLTRRVRRLTNHVEGLQADLRLVNEALKTLRGADASVRPTPSVDSVLGATPPSTSVPAAFEHFARSAPKLEMDPAVEAEAPSSRTAKAAATRKASAAAVKAAGSTPTNKLVDEAIAAVDKLGTGA